MKKKLTKKKKKNGLTGLSLQTNQTRLTCQIRNPCHESLIIK